MRTEVCLLVRSLGSGKAEKSYLNSRHSLTSQAALFLGFYNLSYISLYVCVRGLCQAHWLWKNNLTGFNLLPPSPPPQLFVVYVSGSLGIHALSELTLQIRVCFMVALWPAVGSEIVSPKPTRLLSQIPGCFSLKG